MRLRGVRSAFGRHALPDKHSKHDCRSDHQNDLRCDAQKHRYRKVFGIVRSLEMRNAKFGVLHLNENDSQFQIVNRYLTAILYDRLHEIHFRDKEVDNLVGFL